MKQVLHSTVSQEKTTWRLLERSTAIRLPGSIRSRSIQIALLYIGNSGPEEIECDGGPPAFIPYYSHQQ